MLFRYQLYIKIHLYCTLRSQKLKSESNSTGKNKVLPYSLLSVGLRADPSVQAVSQQVILGGRLPLLSARPAVTFPAKERRRPSTCTKLYCLLTEVHRCE